MVAAADVKAIRLGHPSYVWRSGQDRRLTQIRRYVPLEKRRILMKDWSQFLAGSNLIRFDKTG